jgi:hypothetical protein
MVSAGHERPAALPGKRPGQHIRGGVRPHGD